MTKANLDRFKFRWFDTSINFMAEVISLDTSDDYAVVRYSFSDKETPNDEIKLSNGILMQSTGLRDKHGKLIYEGDIIKQEWSYLTIDNNKGCVFLECDNNNKAIYRDEIQYRYYQILEKECWIYGECIKYEVSPEWEKQYCSSPLTKNKWDYIKGKYHYIVSANQIYDCEIIGNIYENPELLEETNK